MLPQAWFPTELRLPGCREPPSQRSGHPALRPHPDGRGRQWLQLWVSATRTSLPHSQCFLYSVPQFTPNLALDSVHRDPEQTHGVSAAAPTAHHYPPHSLWQKERTAVFLFPAPPHPLSLLLPPKQEQSCRSRKQGWIAPAPAPSAALANIS